MGRQPCCDGREGLKKGPWSAEEDRKLVSFISTHGHGCWREVPKLAGLLRCGKSCRLRWINYLRPDLKRGMLSPEEENLIIHLHASYGNKWSRIAAQLPGRTDNEIKNCWNTRIKKKLKDMGIDPVTHRPLSGVNGPPGLSHTTGVNVPPGWIHRTPSLGHLPREPFNASAYQYNMMAKRLQQEGLVGASPNSVMSPQVTTSLSHTPPNTKCDDEHSINYSADSDRSLDSNVLANVHELRSIDKVQGDPHMMLACQLNGKDGLQNASHMLHACQAAPTALHELYNPPHMHNPPYMLHDALDMHYPAHMLHNAHNLSDTIHNASHMHPHMLRIAQLQASHAAQTMPHLVPAFQLRGLHASSPARKMEDTRIASSSSMVRNDDDGCDEGNEAGVAAIKEENERMLASNYMKNVSPYVPASMIKYSQVGVEPQTSQYELQDEEGTSTSVLTTTQGGGQWSNMMSEVFLSEPADAVAREPQVMSPLLYETSQALGQHNFASACNSLNIGQWSNTDCLWF